MKIEHERPSHYKFKIGNVESGHPVAFEKSFHQDNSSGDIFLRLLICSGYIPRSVQDECKVGVVNLRTGKLSYIDRERHCRLVPCKIVINENDPG